MVSLRSGSTTDNKEICGPAEVSSKRSSRRPATKKGSRLAETKTKNGSTAANVAPYKSTQKQQSLLAPIAETPRFEAPTGEGTLLHLPRTDSAAVLQPLLNCPKPSASYNEHKHLSFIPRCSILRERG